MHERLTSPTPWLFLLLALMTARALAQQIVIEPTNGRASTSHTVRRPADVESTPPAAQSTPRAHAARPRAPRKLEAHAPAEAPRLPEAIANPAPALATPRTPAPPERPAWATLHEPDTPTLRAEIARALARDPRLSGAQVESSTGNGLVLTGHLAGPAESEAAERLARSYAANTPLVNRIQVGSATTRMNAQ